MDANTFRQLIMTPAIFTLRTIGGSNSIAATLVSHDTPESRCLLTAIAGQESGWSARTQIPNGQAHSFWQCEEKGAVLDVLTRDATAPIIAAVCRSLYLSPGLTDVFQAIVYNDAVAYAIARLRLYLDPAPLPAIGDENGSWDYYIRCWGPGKPDRERWSTVYPASVSASTAKTS